MAQQKKKIVFIGDSIINGFPLRRSQCFVSLFRDLTGHEVVNKGENGETTAVILHRFPKDALEHRPHSVVVHGGGNDLFLGREPDRVFHNLVEMADMALASGIRPILLTPLPIDPDLARKRWAPNGDYVKMAEGLAYLREALLELHREATVDFSVVDLADFYAELLKTADVTEYMIDGLHPTEAGHAAIASFLADQAASGRI